MTNLTWEDYNKIDLRVGTIIEVNDFPEAIKPAYQIKVDLGENIGIKQSSAQITELYTKDELINKQVIVIINFPPKKIGPFISECLITGFYKDEKRVVLATTDLKVPNGSSLK